MGHEHGGGRRVKPVTIAEFFRVGHTRLNIELIAGKGGMDRPIIEPSVNRPGLALTGFFQYFAFRRIQVLGHAEHAYLFCLDEKTRFARLKAMFDRRIPCVVVTRHRKVLPELIALGDELKIPIMRCPWVTGRFINAATLLMEDLQAPRITMQGTMVEILGIGVMITGRPGIGKSEAALALIKKGYSLVSDDVTAMHLDSSGAIMTSAMDATRYHMELRGLGIIHVPSLFGVASVRSHKKLDLIVNLESAKAARIDPGQEKEGTTRVLGQKMPCVEIPVAPGRDISGLIEVAALDHKLKQLGHDAAKELDERLIEGMRGGVAGRE